MNPSWNVPKLISARTVASRLSPSALLIHFLFNSLGEMSQMRRRGIAWKQLVRILSQSLTRTTLVTSRGRSMASWNTNREPIIRRPILDLLCTVVKVKADKKKKWTEQEDLTRYGWSRWRNLKQSRHMIRMAMGLTPPARWTAEVQRQKGQYVWTRAVGYH